MSDIREVEGYKVNIQKSILFLHDSCKQLESKLYFIYLLLFLKIYLIANKCKQGRGREVEGEDQKQTPHPVSMELDMGLNLMNWDMMT